MKATNDEERLQINIERRQHFQLARDYRSLVWFSSDFQNAINQYLYRKNGAAFFLTYAYDAKAKSSLPRIKEKIAVSCFKLLF